MQKPVKNENNDNPEILSMVTLNKLAHSLIVVYTQGFRSVLQGLNDMGGCCEVHAETLPKLPTSAAVDQLSVKYATVTTLEN